MKMLQDSAAFFYGIKIHSENDTGSIEYIFRVQFLYGFCVYPSENYVSVKWTEFA